MCSTGRPSLLPLSSTFGNTQNVAGQAISQISNDEFAFFGDVANLGFRPMTIGMVAIVSGCHPRFK
jgi:hypothetical protein